MTAVAPATTRPMITIEHTDLLIGGRAVPAAEDRRRADIDPSTGDVIAHVAEATPEDVARAVTAARTAFDTTTWPARPARERGRILLRAADLMRTRAEEFARLESLDAGKPLLFSRIVDIATAADLLEYYGSLAMTIEGATRSTATPMLAYTLRHPLGVVAAITPFNFPLVLSLSKIAPALAAGNTVVHKPAEDTPLTALALGALLTEAGVPDGVMNVVTGGTDAGQALVEDPRVDKIGFTGSSAVGRSIAERAGATLKKLTMELGGKSANLVFADADIEAAVKTSINGFVFNTGQFCMAGTRLLIERPVYDEVVEAIGAAIPHVPIGDPFAEGTVIGPVAGARHADKVRGYVSAAHDAGLRVLGDRLPTGLAPGGSWVAPAVIADVSQESRWVQDEIFGPVVTAQPFDTEKEAMSLANGTNYALAAGLQTSDVTRAHRVAAGLQAGVVWVNQWGTLDTQMPAGGSKSSGYGRECGPEGLEEYLQTKSVLVAQ